MFNIAFRCLYYDTTEQLKLLIHSSGKFHYSYLGIIDEIL